jgi:hypothetical protein
MPLRLDMLDDATLEAAASRGLLRRARRDLETGSARVTRHDEDEAEVEMTDATVTLRRGGLCAATCTCRSRETCRHIVGAIILLRETPEPTNFQESVGDANNREGVPETASLGPDPLAEILAFTKQQLIEAFGRALLSRAADSLSEIGDSSVVVAGQSCIIAFKNRPKVRYVAGLGIAGMVCKAAPSEARILRAQALLAVRRAHGPEEAQAEAAPVETAREDVTELGALLDVARDLLIDWALSGLAAAPEALEERLFDAAIAARARDLFRLSAELRRLSEDVRRRRDRDVEFESLESLQAASRSFALVEALRRLPEDH